MEEVPTITRTLSHGLSSVVSCRAAQAAAQCKRAIKPACLHRPSLRLLLPSGKRLPINGNSVPIQPRTPPFKNPCPSPVASFLHASPFFPSREPQPLRLSCSFFIPPFSRPSLHTLDSSIQSSMAIEFS
ncbi:hypothetical protein PVAP13_2KG348233 [Panicum virgatum]|uniref:Uncharacterized protein n=1 Tax=Panicum virgatum TaxID=38727 RepID=A0A8T0W615_PANVG|nr:hypothetical protein PVAP13_2KG348233 [Panicum virgatum]